MINFFILAAGHGDRAIPLTLLKPKPLFPLNGKPLIEIMLAQLKEMGLANGFINLHYKSELMRKCITVDSRIKFLYEDKLTGNMVLKRTLEHINEFLLVINGDVFSEIPVEMMVKKILETDSDGILLVRKNSGSSYSSIITKGDDFVKRIKGLSKDTLMYTGISLFRKNVLEKLNELSIFDTLARNNFKIKVMEYDGVWLDIGEPGLYFESNFEYKRYMNDSSSNSLSENVRISSDSSVSHSIIWENTTIGKNSEISDCIVTGNLSLSNVNYSNQIITHKKIYKL